MRLAKFSILVFLFSCASGNKIILSEKAQNLKKFNFEYSKNFCKRMDIVVYKEVNLGLFGTGNAERKVLNQLAESGANYYSAIDVKPEFFGNKLLINANGYSCAFENEDLKKEAEDIEIFGSDHIPANCDRIGKVDTNYYHDDFEQYMNKIKNKILAMKGNVGNIELSKTSLKIGAYKCTEKQMAIARIESRKERMELEKIRIGKINNALIKRGNETIENAYFEIKKRILNSY